ncbi:MAG: 4Fe-4S binding protein [Selenomonas sp.]|nr:4Fe-4S binding protein [Selenomonas sp.]
MKQSSIPQQRHWYHYLWLWSILYFSLGFFHIVFAWLGLISFVLPLLFAIFGGNKLFCNRYCDRGQFLRFFGGQQGCSRRHEMPAFLYSKAFRIGFMVFFFAMFGSVVWTTWFVAGGSQSLHQAVTLFWSVELPRVQTYPAAVPPWVAQFSFGLYSLMLTSEIIAIGAMLWFRPRAWCAFCPMGTLTQGICKLRRPSEKPGT